ncbi:MAG: hypothetical protein O2894_09100 [Planctomycetota bacterium]|nr:hypothetical protein [Planctomycetota bacterium]
MGEAPCGAQNGVQPSAGPGKNAPAAPKCATRAALEYNEGDER